MLAVSGLARDPASGWIYAGGVFKSPDGASRNIARWNGTSWSYLGSGVNEFGVSDIVVGGNGEVWVGSGGFTVAGGKPADGIARWDAAAAAVEREETELPAAAMPALVLSEPFPNPFRTTATIELSVDKPQRVEVVLYDVAGRRVRRLADGLVSQGAPLLIRLERTGLSAGTYLVHARGKESSKSRAVVLVR